MPRMKRKSPDVKRKQQKLRMRLHRERELEEKAEEIAYKQKMYRRQMRGSETVQAKTNRRMIDKEQTTRKRQHETSNERRLRLNKLKERASMKRTEEGPDEKRKRLHTVKTQVAKKRTEETSEDKAKRLEVVKEQTQLRRLQMPEEAKRKLLLVVKQQKAKMRKNESMHQKTKRLNALKQHMAERRQQESTKERESRLRKLNQRIIHRRQHESSEQKDKRLQASKEQVAKSRTKESQYTKKKNNEKLRIRMQLFRTRRRLSIPTHPQIVKNFLEKVKDAADYICCSCNRLMYRLTVVHLKEEKYEKAPKSLLESVFSHRKYSADGEEWICRTCHLTLKRGKLPAQAKANNMLLSDIPKELGNLTSLELRLVAQRIPFMKMVGLPRGRQHAIHGPAVNVPSDVTSVCKLFPRLPSECQIIPLKFKRRLKYKSHYMYDYVSPERVLTALRWLKLNNPLYKNITINENWTADASAEDRDLWEGLLEPNSHDAGPQRNNILGEQRHDQQKGTSRQRKEKKLGSNLSEAQGDTEISNTHDIVNNFDILAKTADHLGMEIVDVPGDGDCLFTSVCYHLKHLHICKMSVSELRMKLADFMRERPGDYREFVCARVEATDRHSADTDAPGIEDHAIAAVDNPLTRQEICWIKYLDRLEHENQWGEHIALQAVADMFGLDIIVHCSNETTLSVTPRGTSSVKRCHLGLIEQCHYVIFKVKDSPCNQEVLASQHQFNSVDVLPKECVSVDNDTNAGNAEAHAASDEEDMESEDEVAFEEDSNIKGLPYETSMLNDHQNISNSIISLAPGELQKPKPLLCDTNFEELAFPDKFPEGRDAFSAVRPITLTPKKYFNQRLLDCDGRFAKSIEYLLSAQYATENKQVQSDINHFVYRRSVGREHHGQPLNVGMLRNVQHMNALVKADTVYRILKNIRGSPGYFQTLLFDVLAMVRQLGVPTWFFTVSAADMQWPDLIQTIARQYGKELSDEDVKNLSFDERCTWLRSNPPTAARHFQYRLELLFRDILKSNAHPLGEITDYVYRIEFQARGSPHAHTLLWVKDAPRVDIQSDHEVCDFIDKHLTTAMPTDDTKLGDLVQRLQTHRHSSYCRKKKSCRFAFPRPPSSSTVLTRELDGDDSSIMKKAKAKSVLNKVCEVLHAEETTKDISLKDLLEKAEVEEGDYEAALSISEKGRNVILAREPREQNVNAYNPTILKAWQANMDLQFIVDAYACVMYVASYMTKDEKGLGQLLKQACKESADENIQSMLRRVGSVFLNNREVSAQEASYRLLSLPLKKLSRRVVFVNTDEKSERVAVLKTKEQLKDRDEDDEDVFQSNVIERYILRPEALETLSLAEFAANYATAYKDENDQTDDSVPNVLDGTTDNTDMNDSLPKRIKLKSGKGQMHLRRRSAIIRYRKWNEQKDPSNYYRSKLMLFLAWRKEEFDLLGGFCSYYDHYQNKICQIRETERKYTAIEDIVDAAIENNNQHGPPEHIWALLAPGAEHENRQDEREQADVERDIEQEDLNANAEMIEKPFSENHMDIVARYDLEQNRDVLPRKDYRKMMRYLNMKQREIVLYHRKWCKEAAQAIREGRQPTPYRIFLSGPGGVGKSHVIKLIHSDTKHLLSQSRQIARSDIPVLLTAPTGVAAFNIEGMTVHSALLLRVSKYGNNGDNLSPDKLNSLRSKLENLQLIIIDEVSMVGSDMLLNIHRRLGQIKGLTDESALFGNVCVLAVGDLYQLPAVCQSQIYQPVKNPIARLYGSLWKDHFQIHELDEIMRQQDDKGFAELLCRVRNDTVTIEDINLLRTRELRPNDPDYPINSLHVYAYNEDVDKWNNKRLRDTAPDAHQRVSIHAIDDKADSTGLIDLQNAHKSAKRSETAGLHTVLEVAIGARVMLLYNLDTSDGLVNGVIGTVVEIKKHAGKITTILVEFDNEKVGKHARMASQWREDYPSAVPIKRQEGKFEKHGKRSAQTSRLQFPLTLAWAITIHKCQGLTLDNVVVSMRGAKRFGNGQAYVAFSRVRTLQGLHIIDFDQNGIKANRSVNTVMETMRLNKIDSRQFLHENNLQCSLEECTTVGHLNIHYFLEKMEDITSDYESKIFSKTDVMCFTETYLTKEHDISKFLSNHDYIDFRLDVPSVTDHQGLHGVMICAVARLKPIELPLMTVCGLQTKVVALEGPRSRLIVAVMYRPPSQPLSNFVHKLDQLLAMMPLEVPTILLGDFNDDISRTSSPPLQELMAHYKFVQYVTRPTTDARTLVDHIYFNRERSDQNNIHTDVHDVYYSDHDIVFLTTDIT